MTEITTDIPDERFLFITPELIMPRAELQFRTSRSGGPGGQHVNKVETRVELLFHVAASPALSEAQRECLLGALRSGVDNEGVLHIIADSSRSQYRNREEAIARLVVLLQHALRPRITRKPTRIPRGVQEHRLQEKKHRAEIKRRRSGGGRDE